MKRVLALVITFMVIGLTIISAQDYAQMEKDLKQVEADLKAGKITPVQAQQQIMAIQQKYLGMSDATIGDPTGRASTSGSAAGQAQNQRIVDQATQTPDWMQQPQQQQAAFPTGKTSGWPSNSILSQCSLPNLRQPAGTTVSYDYDTADGRLTVYIKNGTQKTVDDLSNAIVSGNVGAGSPYRGDDYVNISLKKPSRLTGYDGYYVSINLIDGGVTLSTAGSAQ
jgi:hypothetical protein